MVVFELAGALHPLDERTAELLAVRLRVDAAEHEGDGDGSASLADAIESALVGEATDPIAVDEPVAEPLFRHLNLIVKDPDEIDPAYSLYLEVRRYLGRLYS